MYILVRTLPYDVYILYILFIRYCTAAWYMAQGHSRTNSTHHLVGCSIIIACYLLVMLAAFEHRLESNKAWRLKPQLKRVWRHGWGFLNRAWEEGAGHTGEGGRLHHSGLGGAHTVKVWQRGAASRWSLGGMWLGEGTDTYNNLWYVIYYIMWDVHIYSRKILYIFYIINECTESLSPCRSKLHHHRMQASASHHRLHSWGHAAHDTGHGVLGSGCRDRILLNCHLAPSLDICNAMP